MKREKEQLELEPKLDHHIFVSLNGKPLHSSGIQKAFKRLLNRANLPKLRFHDLRHTAASLLLGQGMPVLEVSRQLGHSRASTTLDIYAHLVPGLISDAVAKLDQALSPITAELLRNGDFDNIIHVRNEEKIIEMPEFPSKIV